jgi:ubiquinone/menaquinone biosynthesis C-methylase UbiE
MVVLEITKWILGNLPIQQCDSTEYMYNDMDSQAFYSLPVIYRPFDITQRGDWSDEGQILDFIISTEAEGKCVLDFGPGDGWPSLRMAPFVQEMTGVDASSRRVEACRKNAERLGIGNTRFEFVPAGNSLPFASDYFDVVVAASSIEQTPDPRAAIKELHRVLKPGGKLRICYEDLDRYRGKKEKKASIDKLGDRQCLFELYDRDPDKEEITMIRVFLGISDEEMLEILGSSESGDLDPYAITPSASQELRGKVKEIRVCSLHHPSGSTYVELLKESGFSAATGTHNGGCVGWRLFGKQRRNVEVRNHKGLRDYLLPIVEAVVSLEAPLLRNPWITATK